MDVLTGSDISINVVFEIDGQTLVPDSGSVRLNLRDHAGTLLITNQTVTVGTGLTSVSIAIAGSHNTLSGSQKFARRVAVITFTSGGQSHMLQITYRVVSWLNHSVTPANVRFLLGANTNDLPDAAIDILKAYFEIEARLTEDSVVLNDVLVAGGLPAIYANDAITCTAALQCLPSMRLGVSQSEENGALSYSRFQDMDWEALEASLRDRLGQSIDQATGLDTATPTLLVFTTRTDPITGA